MSDGTPPENDTLASEPLDKNTLTINELKRFTKTSPRLVLEAYSHCEVPAGCGGAVLRWVNPESPVPMGTRVFSSGFCENLTINGVAYRRSQVSVPPGKRFVVVLKLTFRKLSLKHEVCKAVVGSKYGLCQRTGEGMAEFTFPSRTDGSWLYTTQEPSQEALAAYEPDLNLWHQPSAVVSERPTSLGQWSWDECTAHDAEAMLLPAKCAIIWLRTVVDVPTHALQKKLTS